MNSAGLNPVKNSSQKTACVVLQSMLNSRKNSTKEDACDVADDVETENEHRLELEARSMLSLAAARGGEGPPMALRPWAVNMSCPRNHFTHGSMVEHACNLLVAWLIIIVLALRCSSRNACRCFLVFKDKIRFREVPAQLSTSLSSLCKEMTTVYKRRYAWLAHGSTLRASYGVSVVCLAVSWLAVGSSWGDTRRQFARSREAPAVEGSCCF